MISNCWLWAMWQFFRRGGFVIGVRSRHGWWKHWYWSCDMRTFQEFVPLWAGHRDWSLEGTSPPILFRGRVVERDVTVLQRGANLAAHRRRRTDA